MAVFRLVSCLFLAALVAIPASPAKKAPARKSTPGASARAKPGAKKATSSRRSRTARLPSYRLGQQQPTRERYQEIQQALVDRGYLPGPATGDWRAESAEALKRFQQDQNLRADGKLHSLALIALGLGPKRSPASAPEKPLQGLPPPGGGVAPHNPEEQTVMPFA